MKFTRAEIENCVEVLKYQAREIGETHSQIMQAKGRMPTPQAYLATNFWYASEIIESYLEMSEYYEPLLTKLREENYELICQLRLLESKTPESD